MTTLVPILNYESSNHWYTEARYNYEEIKTFSFYVGKTFSKKEKLSYSVTPMGGGVVGKFKGISTAMNAVVEYKDLFLSTQSQYTVSLQKKSADFLYAWSEIGYQPWNWFYVGITAQQTYIPRGGGLQSEPGVFIGFNAGVWTLPLYVFNPFSTSNYFVLGINLSTQGFNRNR